VSRTEVIEAPSHDTDMQRGEAASWWSRSLTDYQDLWQGTAIHAEGSHLARASVPALPNWDMSHSLEAGTPDNGFSGVEARPEWAHLQQDFGTMAANGHSVEH
jgi:hypothetical protein